MVGSSSQSTGFRQLSRVRSGATTRDLSMARTISKYLLVRARSRIDAALALSGLLTVLRNKSACSSKVSAAIAGLLSLLPVDNVRGVIVIAERFDSFMICLLYTSPSP